MRLHIPGINISDSATGSGSTTQPSSTFPAAIALAASWDRQLSYDYGSEIAIQLRAQGFAMGLGGGAISQESPEEAEPSNDGRFGTARRACPDAKASRFALRAME